MFAERVFVVKLRGVSATTVLRPIVRSYSLQHVAACAAHVHAGGHAILWESKTRARLVVPIPDKADPQDLAMFSILDLGKQRYAVEVRGALKGLATTLVPKDCHTIVRRRYERDSVHPGPTREFRVDCLDCGACCKDNEVQLFPVDITRIEAGGRADLLKPPYSRRRDGKLMLTLLRSNKHCRHLNLDNMCGIYTIRPDACRDFPVGSECCLFARESELGLTDGLAASA
jgi:uncharacterized protein